MEYVVKIISIKGITHDVKNFTVEKPSGYHFTPGQATEVSIGKEPGGEKRPFTFTSLNTDLHLEFTIKIYRDHNGVTKKLGALKAGDYLTIGDVWGAIEYKGPGYFIAGGAGITPFLAIFRQLRKDSAVAGNKLFFSNKTASDIILARELKDILGENALFTVTNETKPGYDHRRIDESFLKAEVDDLKKQFYVCGPSQMTEDINNSFLKLGVSVDAVVFEK
jgi:ferredoxin-NADP reductase